MSAWIQIDTSLATKPEVRRIVRKSGESPATVCGRLVLFWTMVVDPHADVIDRQDRLDGRDDLDGLVAGYEIDDVIDVCDGDEAFWLIVQETGWLYFHKSGVMVPGFLERFETSAKNRAQASRRKRRQRLREQGVIESAPETEKPAGKQRKKAAQRRSSRQSVTSVTAARDQREKESETETTDRHTSPVPPPAAETDPESNAITATGGEREAGSEEGKFFWQKACQKPEALQRAVRLKHAEFFAVGWREAVAAGWVPDDRDLRRRYLAAAYYVCHPPDGFSIDNAARVLRHKLIERDWKTGRMDGADDDFARDMERRIDGTAQLARSSNLSDSGPVDTGALREAAKAKLQQFAAAR